MVVVVVVVGERGTTDQKPVTFIIKSENKNTTNDANFIISVIIHMKPERKPPCTAVVCCHSSCILVMDIVCVCVCCFDLCLWFNAG